MKVFDKIKAFYLANKKAFYVGLGVAVVAVVAFFASKKKKLRWK